ncbi:alpha/beta-hydrolase [Stipitochalara longipes BDJ]|nr:alpha/beta-hydrolase [Stipitochalara longipes BDJ]
MAQSVTYQSRGITYAANLFFPPGEPTQNGKRAAIVVSHPFGGVKEQTAGLYAKLLAEAGFITLAFDAAYQGASSGEPRYLEDPYQRVEDVKAAVTFLTTRDEVDAERIGALGICASGGYVPAAAATDRRIKAVATISGADTGRLFREGLGGGQSRDDLFKALEQAGKERTLEAKSGKPHLEHIVPNTQQEVAAGTPTLYKEGTDYYRTPRAAHPNSVNWYISRSIDILATYSSYAFVDLISPHPLLMIAGSEADTLYFSKDAIAAAKEPKELFIVPGKTHIDLYDDTNGTLPKLVEFMNKYLEGKD